MYLCWLTSSFCECQVCKQLTPDTLYDLPQENLTKLLGNTYRWSYSVLLSFSDVFQYSNGITQCYQYCLGIDVCFEGISSIHDVLLRAYTLLICGWTRHIEVLLICFYLPFCTPDAYVSRSCWVLEGFDMHLCWFEKKEVFYFKAEA